MKNILSSFYQVLAAPMDEKEMNENLQQEEYVLSEDGERVGLFGSLFGELNFGSPRLSI